MVADFCHQFIGKLRNPLDSEPLFFIVAVAGSYQFHKKNQYAEVLPTPRNTLAFSLLTSTTKKNTVYKYSA